MTPLVPLGKQPRQAQSRPRWAQGQLGRTMAQGGCASPRGWPELLCPAWNSSPEPTVRVISCLLLPELGAAAPGLGPR